MGPGGGLTNTLVLIACIYFSGKIDFTDADNLFRLRVTYGIVQALILAVFGLIYMRITSTANRNPVVLADRTRTTVEQYDLGKLKEMIRSNLMGGAISAFIHFKLGVVPPLFIQSVMGPVQTGQNPLVRLYLLGDTSAELVNRPWKEPPSPFAALMGQQPNSDAPADGPAQPNDAAADAPANNANEASDAPETTASESEQPAATPSKESTEIPAAAAPESVEEDAQEETKTNDEQNKKKKKNKAKKGNKPAAAVTANGNGNSNGNGTTEAVVAKKIEEKETTAAAIPASTPAAAALSESQEEAPGSPAADGAAKPTATKRRKPKAEQ